jgi:hypothetical protein
MTMTQERTAGSKQPPKLTPEQQARARKLREENGLPPHAAAIVARGDDTLANVLKQLLRKERIDKLVAQHDLNRGAATKIVDGEDNLERILLRRRARQVVQETPPHRRLDEVHAAGARVCLVIDPEEILTGRVIEIERLELVFQPDGDEGEPRRLRKLEMHALLDPAHLAVLRQRWGRDRAQDLAPESCPWLRQHIKHARLQKLVDSRARCALVTRRGRVLEGKIVWYSRFEICLKLTKKAEVVLFRHAVHELRE